MTLLQEVQAAAVDDKVPVSTLLRKCAVLAARLDNDELRTWASRELNGYDGIDDLPDYRVLRVPATGHLAGPFGGSGYENITIPPAVLPDWGKRYAEKMYFPQPIATVEDLGKGEGLVTAQWPGNLLVYMQGEGNKFANGMVLWAACQSCAKSSLIGIVDTVRNRVLEFALRLEKEFPTAGDPGQPVTTASQAAVSTIYQQTIIHGNVTGNIATGSPGAVQTTNVTKGDIKALAAALKELGVPADDTKELISIIEKDEDAQPLGPKTSGWLTKVGKKIGDGSIKVAENVSAGTIAKLILGYFGL